MSVPAEHTPGPWRWDVNRKHKSVKLCGGLPAGTFDKTVISFERYGMQGATPIFHNWTKDGWGGSPHHAADLALPSKGREHHADWFALINHPNARLIEAAPDLLAALESAVSVLEAADLVWMGSDRAKSAIAKARGRSPQPATGGAAPAEAG